MRLSIDPSIVPEWGIWEALREIIQGALDSKVEYQVKYEEETEKLTISNVGKLSKQSLLIGHSTKREDSTQTGQHGEGYKLAAVILLREGKQFRVINDDEIWTFDFKYARKYDAKVLNIHKRKWFTKKTNQITWEITGITKQDYAEYNDKLSTDTFLRGNTGYILVDKPGMIFSGGLYVCTKENFTYGYNFDVGVLKLQRDRNLVSDFDLTWETSKCWKGLPDVAGLLMKGVTDVQYVSSMHYTADTFKESNEEVHDKAFNMFKSEHGPKANPCSSEADKNSNCKNVIVPEKFKEAVKASKLYIAPEPMPKALTPNEELLNWADEWKIEYNLSVECMTAFNEILNKSDDWYN